MEYVAVENLNVRDLELCDTIDDDASGIVLLTTRFRVEASTIQKDTEGRVVSDLLSGGQEGLLVVDGNDLGSDVALLCTKML